MSIDWNRFRELMVAARNIVLVSHIRPDCDALGSELGMAAVLRKLGKNVRIVNGQRTPPNLQFLDPAGEILEIGTDIQPAELADTDLFLVLDTSAWVQVGNMRPVLEQTSARKVILDHHVVQDDFGAEVFKRTTAEATGVLIVEAADALGVKLDATMAGPLAAVATDTGWFRFGSVLPETFEVAARLLRAGAVPAGIYGSLYEQETAGRMRLRGRVLSRIAVELEGRLAHTWILANDYQETGALPSDTEDLVNHALQIRGTQFAVILVGQRSGGFKISFRSRCAVDCNLVASRFGGGGHKAAAGAFLEGDFESVQQQVLEHVRESLLADPVGV
jgi:bifunctional oligoribonuclease and PAP phosphatase NrnA